MAPGDLVDLENLANLENPESQENQRNRERIQRNRENHANLGSQANRENLEYLAHSERLKNRKAHPLDRRGPKGMLVNGQNKGRSDRRNLIRVNRHKTSQSSSPSYERCSACGP
ncbi:hypothetical protein OSTOST_09849, partial [Ostertagia ostertagi]